MFFTDNNNNNSKIGKVTYTATTAQYTRSKQDVNTLPDQSVYTTIEIPNTNPPKPAPTAEPTHDLDCSFSSFTIPMLTMSFVS